MRTKYPHYWRLIQFYQDDGFGNLVDSPNNILPQIFDFIFEGLEQ